MTYRSKGVSGEALFQLKIILLLLFETFIGYLLNLYNPLTYIWGVRILLRYMLFFLACTLYTDEKMLNDFFSLLFYVLILNVILTTLQRLSGYGLDSVTGIFSLGRRVRSGSSGLNIFMCIVCTYYLASAIQKKCPMYKSIISLISSVYMAAISELKMFYIELIIILVCITLFTKISFKKIVGSAFGIGIVFIGMKIYDYYYGDKDTLDFASMADYAGITGRTYGSDFSLNRLTAIPYVWKNILDDILKKLFGLGTGFADNISSSILSSGFLKQYGNLGFHLWGMSLELANIGIIGLSIYLVFFVSIFVYAFVAQKQDFNNTNYYVTCKVVVVISFISLLYNTSLIMDIAAPFMYFIMAIPFILNRSKKEENRRNNLL